MIFRYRVYINWFLTASIDSRVRGVGSYKVAMLPHMVMGILHKSWPEEVSRDCRLRGVGYYKMAPQRIPDLGVKKGGVICSRLFSAFREHDAIKSNCLLDPGRFQDFLIKRSAVKPY